MSSLLGSVEIPDGRIMETLVIILSHNESKSALVSNIHWWERFKCPIIVFCYTPCPIKHPQLIWPESVYGGYIGEHTYTRVKHVMQYLRDWTNYPQYILTEYDTICLASDFGNYAVGFHGIIVCNHHPERFEGSEYAVIPYLMSRTVLCKLADAFDLFPEVFEEGMGDRFLTKLARKSGIDVLPHREPGFAVDTITPERFSWLSEAVLSKNARWIHGIKSPEALMEVEDLAKKCGIV